MKLSLSFVSIFALVQIVHAAEADALPSPWHSEDIGTVQVKGSATSENGTFTVKGTLDTWGTNDGFHFVWQRLRGDGQIVARVLTVENTMAHAKGGVMFRDSLAANAKHAEACVTPTDGAQFLARTETGEKTASFHTGQNKGKLPYWVKLVRAGDKVSGFESADGEAWSLVGSTNVTLGGEIYAGVVASSHMKDKLCTATFDKVTVSAKP